MEWKAFTNKVVFGDGDLVAIKQNDDLLQEALSSYESASKCQMKVLASGFITKYKLTLLVGETVSWSALIRTQYNLPPTRIYLLNEAGQELAEFKIDRYSGGRAVTIILKDQDSNVSSSSQPEFSRN